MILKSTIAFLACCGLLLTAGGDDLTGIKCVVMGEKAAKKDKAVKYMDGEVYLCCPGCVKKFEKDPSKFEVKADHQLVLTKQYVQKGCPFSGGAVKDGLTVEVGGTNVGFCCEGCQKKVATAKDVAAKASLVFTKAAFEKGFEKKADKEVDLKDVKCFLMPKRPASKDHAVDYRDGKVYFCCKGCPTKFAKDKAKYATLANEQLVSTGQYTQKACPFSGGAVDEEKTVKINGQEVQFCCGNCVKKVNDAGDDKAKAELVFSDKSFEKGFEKAK